MIAIPSPAAANHHYGTYGNQGYAWLARWYDSAQIFVLSSDCSKAAREAGAWTRVTNSTAGTSEFAGKWPSGLTMDTLNCETALQITHDINIEYSDFDVTHNGGTFWGENHDHLAPASYCTYWGNPYPCGMHPNTVHISLDAWNGASDNSRERLLMHETGHSERLKHHCTSDSVMNDGTSVCNGGAWTSVMVYKATDRSGIVAIYPNWAYP